MNAHALMLDYFKVACFLSYFVGEGWGVASHAYIGVVGGKLKNLKLPYWVASAVFKCFLG